ncbi:MAG: glycosyltransferase family 39 protein [Planctomycetota bacterium]
MSDLAKEAVVRHGPNSNIAAEVSLGHSLTQPSSLQKRARWSRRVLFGLAAMQVLLLGWCARHDGFTCDEVAHLPSGLFHWERGEFGMFNVNPPLVRMIATLPVLALGYQADWSSYVNDIYDRPERLLSREVLRLNGTRSYWLLTVARWTCLPFTLLGMWICWRWAGELYGDHAAVLAAILWCFSPNILGHGHLMTPDIPGASIGIAAFYVFRHWLINPTWQWAFVSGIVFGQAQATKSSWVILFAMWPLLWLFWRICCRCGENSQPLLRELKQMAVILAVGVWSINMWYGFAGTFTALGEYRFLSTTLGGFRDGLGPAVRYRFENTYLAHIPVPFPSDYVQGIDRQKYHFELPDWSYLRGEWRDRGWWHYYVYAAFVKEPLGYWVLGAMAVALGAFSAYRARWRDELLLLIPLILLVVFISSQRGFNRHLRYILPAYPFAFILISRVARSISRRNWGVSAAMAACTAWGVVSSLLVYPHPLSYFNEFAGGALNGRYHLLSSNTDWGQDLLYLKSWIDAHPEASPLYLAWDAPHVDPELAGIELPRVPQSPTPGWHAISVNQLHANYGDYEYFLKRTPVATAGYSILIYQLSEDDCDSELWQ